VSDALTSHVVRFELDIEQTTAGTLIGTVGPPGGTRHEFTGIMEFVALLERLLEQCDAVSTPLEPIRPCPDTR